AAQAGRTEADRGQEVDGQAQDDGAPENHREEVGGSQAGGAQADAGTREVRGEEALSFRRAGSEGGPSGPPSVWTGSPVLGSPTSPPQLPRPPPPPPHPRPRTSPPSWSSSSSATPPSGCGSACRLSRRRPIPASGSWRGTAAPRAAPPTRPAIPPAAARR